MMRILVEIGGAIILVIGLLAIGKAIITPNSYPLTTASAVQISQVYTEATYYAVLGIAAFVLSGILLVAANSNKN